MATKVLPVGRPNADRLERRTLVPKVTKCFLISALPLSYCRRPDNLYSCYHNILHHRVSNLSYWTLVNLFLIFLQFLLMKDLHQQDYQPEDKILNKWREGHCCWSPFRYLTSNDCNRLLFSPLFFPFHSIFSIFYHILCS